MAAGATLWAMDSAYRALAARRLELAFELFAAGEDIKRQQLRREHPDATDAEIETKLLAWLSERPGAEDGDGAGTVRDPREIFG